MTGSEPLSRQTDTGGDMNAKFRLPAAAAILALLAAPAAVAAADETSEEFSKANQLLFLEDHITGPDSPMVYQYELDKKTTMSDEDAFHDEITMTARPAGDNGAKNVTFDYLSGPRDKFIREVDNARGNPIIMVFLQRDVSEMGRLTDGHWRYFQKQIKIGLENDANVEQVQVSYQGRDIPAQRITLRPFSESTRSEMRDYTGKHYVFTLSEKIPGEVYEMRSVLPADGENAEPRIEERLVLKSTKQVEQSAAAE